MSARFHAVAWDVDGVLIDSEPLHLSTFIEVCGRHGYGFDAAENERWLGSSIHDMWRNIPELRDFGLTFDAFVAEFVDLYVAGVHGGLARAPAPAIVAELAGRGVPQAAVSSSPRRIVTADVAAVGAAGHLDPVLSREDVARGKPAPDAYLAAAERIGVAPAHCLAIEDTARGVAAAKAAGCTVIAWPHAMTAAMDFSAADHVLDDLSAFDWRSVATA